MINGKQLAEAGFSYLGVPYSKMDCQAFVEQCLRDCGLEKNLAGSNAWFREVWNRGAVMTPEECVRQLGTVPPGAFLFILAQDGKEPEKYRKDGLGNASHIGIVTGRGEGAIHSSASRGCVAESKFRNKSISGGWNRIGLWDPVSYDYGSSGVSESGGSVQTPSESAPAAEVARVCSENGLPVNTRKGPGKHYDLSKAGKLSVGTLVEVLKRQGEWVRIRCTDKNDAVWTCWMMGKYLEPVETTGSAAEPDRCLWSVTIYYLTESEAAALEQQYPNCSVRKEECG